MAYQVLARKWRPQDFAAVVGQEPIVTALRNALADGRIAQAYLFSGIRGVGKTTVARVLAKALDCERGPTPEPCGECVPCREIARSADLDVLEIDAATYSKVEQVRDLTESLKYGPVRDRYKVVILDEVHRLSRQAFDALLKIVEEPPPHLVFVFATTEIESVPATILSRCQEFGFRRVPARTIAAHLGRIAEAEGIAASDAALRLIARAGEGSVRDAVALLDQLATFGAGRIADDDASRLLGGFDAALLHRLLAAITAGDGGEVAAVAAEVDAAGHDPRHVYREFLGYCRDALHLALGGQPAAIDLPDEEARALAELARGAGYENLLRLLHQLLASEATVRRSDAAGLAAEIAWLRAAELPKLTRIEDLLAGRAPAGSGRPATTSGPSGSGRGERETSPREARAAAPAAAPEGRAATEAPSAAAPDERPATVPGAGANGGDPGDTGDPAAPADPAEPADPANRLTGFLDEVSKRKQLLAAHLSAAEELAFADGELRILYPAGDRWLRDALERPANREAIGAAVAAVFGPGSAWRAAEAAGGGAPDRATPRPSPGAPATDDPAVQRVLDIFGGTVRRVEERAADEEDAAR